MLLRDGTRQVHNAIEEAELHRRLLEHTLSRQEYAHQLQIYCTAWSTLESVAASWQAKAPELLGLLHSRVPALEQDLERLGASRWPLPEKALDRLLRWREEALAEASAGSPAVIGRVYVMEGASLGARIQIRHLRRCPEVPEEALTFFSQCADRESGRWGAFLHALAARPFVRTDAEEIVLGACRQFEALHELFELCVRI